jgi:Ca2+-transporting ATPase
VEGVSVYARTTPEHKLRIVQALHALGQRVAVTGDGTNDAPALAAADIGIAMGETGTDVAREAADMVLADDNFATIVGAVKEGRALYANLKKGVRYYLTIKVALIACTLLPVLLLVPVPFSPVQIILMELFMDLAAAATFVAEQPETDLLREGPRDPKAKFMDRAMIISLFTCAAGLFAAVMVAYLTTWYGTQDLMQAQGIAFITWMLGHVFLALNMRSERQPLFRLGLFSNRLMVLWLVGTVVFVLLVAYVPALQAVFRGVTPTPGQWAMMAGLVLAGTFWMEVRKLITYRYKSGGISDQVMNEGPLAHDDR